MEVPDASVDAILALQLSVAWAGEGRSQPRRLGWWHTDLVDAEGGGDLFARLLPNTHVWASLGAVRDAARRVDERARKASATPDRLVTLFQLGFELDEQLAERMAHHRRHRAVPAEVLGAAFMVAPTFDLAAFESFVRECGPVQFEEAPGGRLLKDAPPLDALTRVRQLVAALAPFSAAYPMPHFRVDERKP